MQTIEPASPANGVRSPVAPSGRFLRNTWYPVLWSTDLEGDALVDRVVLNEPLVFYRADDGTPVALTDICPHRFAPLHLGKRCAGGILRCGYHGLEFDATGACVHNPHGDGRIPVGAAVRSYPMVEKHRILWLWMGDEQPRPERIPDFSIFDNPAPGTLTKFDTIKMAANYELITDNLMDLSHTAFLHEGLLGNDSMTKGETKVVQDGTTVTVSRFNRNVPAVKVYDLMFRGDGQPCDFWDSMRWDAPGCFLLDAGVCVPGDARENGTGLYAVHLLTPESEHSTHYMFSGVRKNIAAGRPPTPEIAAAIGELRRQIFTTQDGLMISAQQRMLDEFPEYTRHPALFAIDAGPSRYKRVLRGLLEAEAAAEIA
jgi:phenylpropionate dioxygenase-like ring-hydroxylating dioxygenase large terminal subunit